MRTSNAIVIAAPPQTIYRFAAATERWPEYLPHYRWVRILEDNGATRVLEMAAWRDRIPIRWVAEQTNDPLRPHITFRHVRGWTRGMEVEWRFESLTGSLTRVTIDHALAFQFPIASHFLGEYIVGRFFVAHVAALTLARMKTLAEAAA